MTAIRFDPAQTPLQSGINLIEASAGTGKTFAIAMLVLRFVVEQGFPIESLLVVTFTKAATEELRGRIRQRLSQARQLAAGNTDAGDDVLISWLAGLDLTAETIRSRLDLALLNIDQAAIYTIHGFCQRVLKDFALESGQLFDAELTGDIDSIKLACVDDFWRNTVYRRPPAQVAQLRAAYSRPEDLLAAIRPVPAFAELLPDFVPLDAHFAAVEALRPGASAEIGRLLGVLLSGDTSAFFKESFIAELRLTVADLEQWLEGGAWTPAAASAALLLTRDGLMEGLHGNKFRAAKNQTGEQRKLDFFTKLNLNTAPFELLAQAMEQTGVVFRRALLEALPELMARQLEQMNVLSFDDLINRVAEALQSEASRFLAAQMQQQYQVALIDEFQDTDRVQWLIFSRLFSNSSLFLIGDPKQAIYKFRGADIFAYLSAKQQAQQHFTLAYNWRSHPGLVAAVNALFAKEQAFLLDGLEFYPVEAALPGDRQQVQKQGETLAPMALWQLPASDSKTGYWTSGKATEHVQLAVVDEILKLLDGSHSLDGKPIKPEDIAILVRSNSQAREFQAVLREVRVPSVVNGVDSVFASNEAVTLYKVLEAVARPGDVNLLKQALATGWFGLDGHDIYRLSREEILLDAWSGRFQGYYEDWRQKGLMAMVRRLLHQEAVPQQLAKTALAERQLTNIQHVLELLQEAVAGEHLSIAKTLAWLRSAMAEAASGQEQQQLRLESDANALAIITSHRAKGLEYPIVFCPFAWQRSSGAVAGKSGVACHKDGRMLFDLGSADFQLHKQAAEREELAEDLRLLYVALTRAKARCYLLWADARTEAVPNQSALAYLLDLAGGSYEHQQQRLQALALSLPQAFAYRGLNSEPAINVYTPGATKTALAARQLTRSLYTPWQMSSYTALTALSQAEVPELPKAGAGDEPPEPARVDEADLLPKGAATGNAVHELLETNTFAALAKGGLDAIQRDQVCQRYGVRLPEPSQLDGLLQTVVSTPLSADDADFSLMNVYDNQCLKEMPFYLAVPGMNITEINRILAGDPAVQPLTAKTLRGFLTGFIDLVFEYKGRFYLADYKTNALADYSQQSLQDAMHEHNYGLQYWIYTLVLHRYLQQRLPGYDYRRHFGGVRYLFVRGMRSGVPMSGIYSVQPEYRLVEALAGLFAGADNGRH